MKFHICPVCENEWKFADCNKKGCKRGEVVCPSCKSGLPEGTKMFGIPWIYLTDALERFVREERKRAGL